MLWIEYLKYKLQWRLYMPQLSWQAYMLLQTPSDKFFHKYFDEFVEYGPDAIAWMWCCCPSIIHSHPSVLYHLDDQQIDSAIRSRTLCYNTVLLPLIQFCLLHWPRLKILEKVAEFQSLKDHQWCRLYQMYTAFFIPAVWCAFLRGFHYNCENFIKTHVDKFDIDKLMQSPYCTSDMALQSGRSDLYDTFLLHTLKKPPLNHLLSMLPHINTSTVISFQWTPQEAAFLWEYGYNKSEGFALLMASKGIQWDGDFDSETQLYIDQKIEKYKRDRRSIQGALEWYQTDDQGNIIAYIVSAPSPAKAERGIYSNKIQPYYNSCGTLLGQNTIHALHIDTAKAKAGYKDIIYQISIKPQDILSVYYHVECLPELMVYMECLPALKRVQK